MSHVKDFHRSELVVEVRKTVIIYKGRELSHLPPIRARMIELLRDTDGVVTNERLLSLLPSGSVSALKVHIYHLREWLADNGADLAIKSVKGEGYLLI